MYERKAIMGHPVDKSNPQVGPGGIRYHRTHHEDDVSLSTVDILNSQLTSTGEVLNADIAGPKTLISIPYEYRDMNAWEQRQVEVAAFLPDVSGVDHETDEFGDVRVIHGRHYYKRTDLKADGEGFADLLERGEVRVGWAPKYTVEAYDEEEAWDQIGQDWLSSNSKPFPVVVGDGYIWKRDFWRHVTD